MAPAPVQYLSPLDYVVFAAVLMISAAIGIWFACRGGKQKTTREYLMGDKSMSILPVSMSLLASFMSAITLLGTPAEIYKYGTQYSLIIFAMFIMIALCNYVIIPIFYKLQVVSVFEYLEMRFNRALRLMCSIIYVVQMLLYMAIVLYAPSLALSAVSGLNVWFSVITVGLVCTFYTTLGGMKAVMWTDTFQIIIVIVGLVAILIQGSIDQDGFGNIWNHLESSERVEFLNISPDPRVRHTVWSLVIGGTFMWLAIYGTNQAQIQRALATPSLLHAQRAMWINAFGLSLIISVCALAGAVVFAQYRDCDPLTTKRILAADQLLPLYVMDRLSHLQGLAGLFTASLFSGALSSISSGLNSLSAVTLSDFVRLKFPNITEERATLVSKAVACVYGIICIALTTLAANLGGVLQATLGIFGMLGGPLLGVFLLGMLYPCANGKGAIAGFLSALAIIAWIGVGALIYAPLNTRVPPLSTAGCNVSHSPTVVPPFISTIPEAQSGLMGLYSISYMWYSLISVVAVTIVGLIVSIATQDKNYKVSAAHLVPIHDRLYSCLPQKMQTALQKRITHDKAKIRRKTFGRPLSIDEESEDQAQEMLEGDGCKT